MKLKLVSTLALAALALLSVPAFAATVNLGALGDEASRAGSLGSVYAPDVIQFTISKAELLTLSATVSNTSANLGGSSLVLSGPTSDSSLFHKTSSWDASFAGYPGILIEAGSYSFTISPAAISGAHANGAYSLTLTGVPEVSTWAMMLSGMAAIGFAGYRRKTVFVPA
jgi:hypothetical protein